MTIDEQLIGALHLSSGGAGEGPAPGHRAFQTSTLTAMLDGAYDGDVSFAELADQGDFGIGTLNGCDGEMIALDGRFLRADTSGAVSEVPPEALTPFAVLTFFEPRRHFTLPGPLGFDELCAAVDAKLDPAEGAEPIVHAVRIEGEFESLHCRSVPRQEKPYRPLAEVLAEQRVFDFEGERGTLLGFRFPNLGLGIGVPGYHLHFLSADRRRGGHLLDCRTGTEPVTVAVDDLADLHVETPPGVAVGAARLSQADVDALERQRG